MMERAKSFIKSTFPRGVNAYRRLVARPQKPDNLAETFSAIYQNNSWRNSESVSGRGSTLARTSVLRETLPILLKELNCQCFLDAPCGDFNWMRQVGLDGIQYVGIDIVADLIDRK